MSAASRALRRQAAHLTRLADQAYEQGSTHAVYSAEAMWDQAAAMAYASAEEERWRERVVRWLRQDR